MVKRNIQDIVLKPLPTEVIVEKTDEHPLCLHGPTLLFSNNKGRYFSCSSCRNKKDCTVHITEEDWKNENVKKRNQKYMNLIPKIDKKAAFELLNKIKQENPSSRQYCINCEELFVLLRRNRHAQDHKIISGITDEQLATPSLWLPTLENNSIEAQYLFARKSINVILSILQSNNIKNVLCLGTPSIQDALQKSPEYNSILLDFDKRYCQFLNPNKFIWYNMFNNYFFNGAADEKILDKFIKLNSDKNLCIIMDPPFGARVEPLVHTLDQLNSKYKKLSDTEKDISIIWAFPYFSEPYIQNLKPELVMHDYQVEYDNHNKFHKKNSKGRKFGSPVRLFTNIPLSSIDLSKESDYKKCNKCNYWVSNTNQHCNKCRSCTSKNGMTYKHCYVCKKCVKPTFFHCATCERCCQKKDHQCDVEVVSQSCYNCHEMGHKKANCPKLQLLSETELLKKRKKHT